MRRFHASTATRLAEGSILSLLEQRGLINQLAGDRNVLDKILQHRKVGFYAGIDPTAPSLHLGHLLPLMVLFWLYHHGHHTVSLIGGATAKVGDPSGRLTSRAKTAESVHDANFQAMHAQVTELWGNATQYGKRHGYDSTVRGSKELLNNATWLNGLSILDFLRTMGSGMRLGTMLGRDTVRNKMEKGDGMSFAEFTYPLLQAWDWWYMYQHHNVQIQIGGADQYGNIVAGMDAVQHIAPTTGDPNQRSTWLADSGKLKDEHTPMGLTVPLLTTSSGEKFGKSAGNAVWLDRSMTSAFDLYGFLLRSPDENVERYLKLFTFVPITEIAAVMESHRLDPGKRQAQHLLASEVLELVHGPEEAAKTRAEHRALRNPSLTALRRQTNADQVSSDGASRTVLPASLVLNTPFSRILYHAGLVESKSEGARSIRKGGVYVGRPTIGSASSDEDAAHQGHGNLTFEQIMDQKPADVGQYVTDGLLILRTGKWKVRVVEVVEDTDFDAKGLDAPGWSDFKQSKVVA